MIYLSYKVGDEMDYSVLLAFVGGLLILSLIYICIINVIRDKNKDLEIELLMLKEKYDNEYKDKYNRLIEENRELKKYKTIYEFSNKK